MTETEMILKQIEELKEQLECFEKKLLDPDDGLYARVKDNTDFRKSSTRWLRIVSIATVGLIGRLIYDLVRGVIK